MYIMFKEIVRWPLEEWVIITSLVAQGHSNMDSALLGTYIHGLAANIILRDRYFIIAGHLNRKYSLCDGNSIR